MRERRTPVKFAKTLAWKPLPDMVIVDLRRPMRAGAGII
jgi:hypothetical protein